MALATPILAFFESTHLASAQATESLTLWPLVRNDIGLEHGPRYVALNTALASKRARVDEVDSEGDVMHVRITNSGAVATLFLFGEEICGAKQNRAANASFLVAAHSEAIVDVSCVEAGRWQPSRTAGFFGSREVVSVSIRRRMSNQVRSSRSRNRRFATDQAEVWDQIDHRIEYACADSDTHSYHDYYISRSEEVEKLTKSFRPLACQVGFVACNQTHVIGVEIIGRTDVFRADFAGLIHSYAIDVIDASLVQHLDECDGITGGPIFDDPQAFLDALVGAPTERTRSIGLGDDLRIGGDLVDGCALANRDLVQLSAFPAAG